MPLQVQSRSQTAHAPPPPLLLAPDELAEEALPLPPEELALELLEVELAPDELVAPEEVPLAPLLDVDPLEAPLLDDVLLPEPEAPDAPPEALALVGGLSNPVSPPGSVTAGAGSSGAPLLVLLVAVPTAHAANT